MGSNFEHSAMHSQSDHAVACYAEPIFLLTTLDLGAMACRYYRKRFKIEHLFKSMKSAGFNLHKSKVEGAKRVQNYNTITPYLYHMKDSYRTITTESTGEFKDRGSKFLAFAAPVFTEAGSQQYLETIRKLHPKARHHCYAYRLGLDKNNYRANDDGEPSGTAGRPILGQIDSFELTNLLIVVVRYFGGTLLGTSGLIHAYKTSAADALAQATIVERIVEDIYRLTFDYALMSNVMNAVKKLSVEIIGQEFENEGMLELAIRQGEVTPTLLQLKSLIGNLRIEEVNEETEIEKLSIAYCYTR